MDNIKKTELNHLQADLADEMSHSRQYKALLALAMVVTLISYLFFSGHLKLGNPLYWGEYFNHGAATLTAFYFMFGSVILLGVFLAWVKHFAYSHFTTYRAIAGVMVTLVGFALLAEMFAALEDQKAKADIQLAGNSAYQATTQPTTGSITGSTALSADIASASQRVARCQQNLASGKEKHCEGDKAKLAALQQQQSAALGAQVAASAETEKLRYQRQDQMKADAHNDFIVGIAKFYAALFGTGTENEYVGFISWANITLMLIIAIAFERLHAFLIEAGRDIKGNIRGLEQRIAQLQERSNPLAGGKHLPPVGQPLFKHNMEPKDGGFKTTSIGFNAPIGKPAVAKSESRFVGFKDTNGLKPAPAPVKAEQPEIVESSGFKQSPAQREMVDKLHQEQMQTYRQELRSGSRQFRDQPLDRPAPAMPTNQKQGATGLQNPALGTAEEQHPLPIGEPEQPQGKPQAGGSEELSGETPSKPQAGGSDDPTGSLYPVWVAAVRAGECRPSVDETWKWIQKRIAPKETGSKTNDRTRIGKMQKGFFARAIHEGLMTINQNYTNGGKKYLWVG